MRHPEDPDAIDGRKRRVREAMRAIRGGTSQVAWAAAGDAVAGRVLALPELSTPTRVLAYAATARELPTAGLVDRLLAAGHAVAVPAITGPRAMRPRRLEAGGIRDLPTGPLGVRAPPAAGPQDPDPWLDEPAVALVPGVAFDAVTGARLGRGGGFYDAWLDGHPACLAVGLALDAQLLDGLPTAPHDRPVAVLVTPIRTLRFSG